MTIVCMLKHRETLSLFGNDQKVYLGNSIDIPKSQTPIIFKQDISWDLLGDNFIKNGNFFLASILCLGLFTVIGLIRWATEALLLPNITKLKHWTVIVLVGMIWVPSWRLASVHDGVNTSSKSCLAGWETWAYLADMTHVERHCVHTKKSFVQWVELWPSMIDQTRSWFGY